MQRSDMNTLWLLDERNRDFLNGKVDRPAFEKRPNLIPVIVAILVIPVLFTVYTAYLWIDWATFDTNAEPARARYVDRYCELQNGMQVTGNDCLTSSDVQYYVSYSFAVGDPLDGEEHVNTQQVDHERYLSAGGNRVFDILYDPENLTDSRYLIDHERPIDFTLLTGAAYVIAVVLILRYLAYMRGPKRINFGSVVVGEVSNAEVVMPKQGDGQELMVQYRFVSPEKGVHISSTARRPVDPKASYNMPRAGERIAIRYIDDRSYDLL